MKLAYRKFLAGGNKVSKTKWTAKMKNKRWAAQCWVR